jgi:hypothetical protein
MTRRTGRRPASSVNRPGRSRRPPVGRPFLVRSDRNAMSRIQPTDLGLQMRRKPIRQIPGRPTDRGPVKQRDRGPDGRDRDDGSPGRP